jgi:hypothetical protein
MAIDVRRQKGSLVMDKTALREAVDRLNEELGIVRDPSATYETARRLIAECGVRPEDNEFSREIIRMRDEKLGGG